jgi:hypothetical protein
VGLGDYSKTTWVNNSSPYINQTNLNNVENKIEKLDEALQSMPVIDFKDMRQYCIKHNTKEINIFDDNSDWTANASTLSDDEIYAKMHTQSVRVLEPDNSAGVCGMYQTLGSTLDLSTFESGDSSDTSDLIVVYLYVSDSAAVNYVELILGDDSTDNYSETWSGLTTGWNVLTSPKSAFTTNNSPDGWNSIDYIACNWYSNANYQNDYVSFNHLTMIREDPDNATYYNEFQRYNGSTWENIFTNHLSRYFLYYDRYFGEIVLFRHTPANDETELHMYCDVSDFVAKVSMRCLYSDETGNAITWYVDSDNYIEIYITSDTLTLMHREAASNGTETKSINVTWSHEINFWIEKIGQTIRVIAEHKGDVYVIEYQTSISATDEGCLYFGGIGTTNYGVYKDFVFANSTGFNLEHDWDRPVMVLKTEDQSLDQDTSMQGDYLLYIKLPAHGIYQIEANIIAVSANATPDIKIDWNTNGEYTLLSARQCLGPAAGITDLTNSNVHNGYYALASDIAYGLEGTVDESIIREKFIIQTHKEMVLIELRWAQNVYHATPTIVESGSNLVVTKLQKIGV